MKKESGSPSHGSDEPGSAPAPRRDASGTPQASPPVSVVINTYNRASSLESALHSLPRQNYSPFEVIVVNGPSDDATEEVLQRHRNWIRVGTCQDRNLSVSRNVGIAMARGDLVAFLDDDAVPDENWLRELVPAFEDPEVAGASALVFDHTGCRIQYQNIVSTRLTRSSFSQTAAPPDLSFPGTMSFPRVSGGACCFLRSVLFEVGGFDEEYDYFLDESDLCLRVIEAGYKLAQADRAHVYHFSRPGHLRNEHRVIVNWFPIIKNTIYYCCRHALGQGSSFESISEAVGERVREAKAALEWHIRESGLGSSVLATFTEHVKKAWEVGLARGLNRPPRLMGSQAAGDLRGPIAFDTFGSAPGVFRRVEPILPESEKLAICLLSQAYPPSGVGGITTLTASLANGLAEAGHTVHVLTRSPYAHSTVEFERGVWVHRIVEQDHSGDMPAPLRAAPRIWNYSRSMLEEVRRLAHFSPVDMIEAPLWDSEGIAFVVDGSYPVITSLQTPFKVAYASNPDWATDDPAGKGFHEAIIRAEEYVLRYPTAIWSISRAVMDTIRRSYGIDCSASSHVVIPLGIDPVPAVSSNGEARSGVMVLYVGRIEGRKGTDVLLEAIPSLCEKHPQARFCIAGQEVNPAIRAVFLRRHSDAAFLERVEFLGQVPDDRLESLYASCDIFVAPSRYESFGLVYLEAMRYGKPVVACRVGGSVEVVEDGITGLLVEPGDSQALEAALDCLLADADRRRRMGEAARCAFLARFTRQRMVEASVQYYRGILNARPPASMVARLTPWNFCIPSYEDNSGLCRIPLRGCREYLVYGPYRELPKGQYSALFDCSIEIPEGAPPGSGLEFDVAACWGGRTFPLARAIVNNIRPTEDQRLAVSLDFSQPEDHAQVEFRIRTAERLPRGYLTFSSVTVFRRASPNDPTR
jgi:glycosyltransferase involved in cell wall biosynthesis/GT2 family glycosyltransferase